MGKNLFSQLVMKYGYAALSGIMLILVQPPLSLSPLAFVALVPLMYSLDKNDLRLSFIRGFATGVIAWLGIIYWVVVAMNQYGGINIPLSILILVLFVLYLSLYTGIFALSCAYLERRTSAPLYLVAAPVWVILEYARGIVMTGFPWSYLGHSQFGFLHLIQVVSVAGTLFVSFMIVAVNSVIYTIWARRKVPIIFTIITLILLAASLTYGVARLKHKDEGNLKAAIVQGNISQDIKWDDSFKMMTVNTYYRLSFGLAQSTDLIVWPETAMPFLLDRDPGAHRYVKAVPVMLKSRLLYGTIGMLSAGNLLNSVHYIDPNGYTAGTYNKVHLVPFGEYTPIASYFPFLAKITAIGADFKPGEGHRPIETEVGKVGVLICFEGIFPYITNETVRQGAEVLVNLTNDAWYNRTSAPYQHFAFYIFRAIETDRYVLRSANTGISAIIDPRGRIKGKTPIFTEEVLRGTYALKNTQTFYVRHGDYFVPICLGLLAVVAAAGLVRKRKS